MAASAQSFFFTFMHAYISSNSSCTLNSSHPQIVAALVTSFSRCSRSSTLYSIVCAMRNVHVHSMHVCTSSVIYSVWFFLCLKLLTNMRSPGISLYMKSTYGQRESEVATVCHCITILQCIVLVRAQTL